MLLGCMSTSTSKSTIAALNVRGLKCVINVATVEQQTNLDCHLYLYVQTAFSIGWPLFFSCMHYVYHAKSNLLTDNLSA